MSKNPDNLMPVTAVRMKASPSAGDLIPTGTAPGTLVKTTDINHDEAWGYVADGLTSASDFMDRVTVRELESGNTALQPVDDDGVRRAFSRHGAKSLLAGGDPSFDADAALPSGQTVGVYLKDLIALVEPFMRTYAAQQRAQFGAGDDLGEGKDNVTSERRNPMTGLGVGGGGIWLPVD